MSREKQSRTSAARVALAGLTVSLRQIAYVAHLAGHRLSARPTAALVAVGGVALAAAAFAATLGGGLMIEDRNVGNGFGHLPRAEQSVEVTHFGILSGGSSYRTVDSAARSALASLAESTPVPVVQFRELRLGADRVVLLGVDDPARFVALGRGRPPRPCSSARCELVLVRGSLSGRRLGRPFAVVGRGRLAPSAPFGRFLASAGGSSGETLGRGEPAALVVASDPHALSELPALESIYRTYAWVAPLRRDDVRAWRVASFGRQVAQQRNALRSISDGFGVEAPAAQLLDARKAGQMADRRLRLVGGEAAALLLAFAVFVAATMRGQEHAAWARLTWFGARGWQIILLATIQTVLLAGLGVALGWALGALVAGLIASRIAVPAGELVTHALLTREAVVMVALLGLAAVAALLVALLGARVRVGGRTVQALDVAALGALAVLVLLVALGGEAAPTPADQDGSGVLALVPGLTLFVAAVVTARVLTPSMRALQRVLARSSPPLRLAALSIARTPGQTVVTAAFLVVSVGLAVFTLLYVGTLRRGIDDQAAYSVPPAFLVREKIAPGGLVAPLQAASIDRFRSLAPGTHAVPVIRHQGSVGRVVGSDRFTLIALPAAELQGLDGWRTDFSSTPLDVIAKRLEPKGEVGLRAVVIPPDADELILPVRVVGDDVRIAGVFIDKHGEPVSADFGQTRGATQVTLRVPVRGTLVGARLLGIRFGRLLAVEAHAHGGGPVLRGLARLGQLAVRRPSGIEPLGSYDTWVGVGGARNALPFGPNAVDYLVSGAADAFFRPRQPTDERPIPAVVSPQLAALADEQGRLGVRLSAGFVSLRVVGTARHFPSVVGLLVAVDRDTIAPALQTLLPGTGTPNEIWLDVPDTAATRLERALARPPFDALEVRSRAALRRELEADPLARGTLVVLLAATVTALALGILAVFLSAETDARDGSGELFDLEQQGAAPAALRRQLRLRLLLVTLPGIFGGALAGLALSAMVVGFVELTATATSSEPPLVLSVDWTLLLLTLSTFLAATAAVAVVRSRRAFRGAYAVEEAR